ncbi:MAG: signal peptidase II [Clostridiales bacterium]|nr:signal peptidase II [Clostridiales bacterium]
MILVIVSALFCIFLDRVTKMAAVTVLELGESKTVFEGLLNFTYVQNEGMAFGWLADYRYIFMCLSVILLAGITVFIFWYRKQANHWLKLACGLVLGGGVGNMIDRVALGYVIDFIDVKVFSFWTWVFNVADAAVCIGVLMLAVYLFFDSRQTKKANHTLADNINEDYND